MKLLWIYKSSFRNNFLLPALLLCILSPFSFAQVNFPIGSRAAALANAVVMDSGLWAVSHNQAGLGDYHCLSIGFHNENKYVIPEAALHALVLSVPLKQGTFGFSYSYFGYTLYNESKFGAGFGRRFGEKFSAGIQLNYHYIYISSLYPNAGDYENQHALTVEGGIQYKPIRAIRIGVHVFNPSRSRLSPSSKDTLMTTVRAGLSYCPFKKLWMAIETEKSLNHNLQIKTGIEYEIYEGLFLRTGIITHPVQNTFGLGFNISRIKADVAFSHDPVLGFTPHLSFEIRLR